MEKSFKSIIEASRSILVLLADEPNFDQVAAALSLYLAIEGKKDVVISCPSQMRVEYNRLVGVDKITQEIGSKNMVIRFVDYPADQIERVSYDIENQEFRLTIIPKPNFEAPQKDQIVLGYSGVSADTTILVGGEEAGQFPALNTGELLETKIVHVGINDIVPPEGKNIISLSRPSSSVSEIVADYIKELEGGFHPDIATNLLSGIHEGSKNFTKKEVNTSTFKIAAELMAAGGKYTKKEEFGPIVGGNTKFSFPPVIPSGSQEQATENRPFTFKTFKGAKKQDGSSPQEVSDNELPRDESVNPPTSWLKSPKIYKGNSVS